MSSADLFWASWALICSARTKAIAAIAALMPPVIKNSTMTAKSRVVTDVDVMKCQAVRARDGRGLAGLANDILLSWLERWLPQAGIAR